MHYDFQGQAIQFRVQMDQPIGKEKADLKLQENSFVRSTGSLIKL